MCCPVRPPHNRFTRPRAFSDSHFEAIITRYNTDRCCWTTKKKAPRDSLVFHSPRLLMLLLLALVPTAVAQINLGQFGFHPTGNGGWDLGLGQSANIMGFGGDRGLKLGQGPQGFGLQSGGGALVAGERIGVDSGLGVAPTGGVDLGSQLNFGRPNPNPLYPGGQFGSFLDNIKNFFSGMFPPPAPAAIPIPIVTTTMHPTLRIRPNTEGEEREVLEVTEPSFIHKWTASREIIPKSGEVETLSAIDGNSEKVDNKFFDKVTNKPRQLPGLVEFGED